MKSSIEPQATVGQIVAKNPAAKVVFKNRRIDFCCGGGIDLAAAAKKSGVPLDVLVKELDDIIANPPAGMEAENRDWSTASLTELCDHIEKRHHTYMHKQLPILDDLIAKVVRAHGEKHGTMLNALQDVYRALRAELESHLQKEEQILFPYIRQTEAYALGHGPHPTYHCGRLQNPIQQMAFEHENAGQALAEMHKITKDFALPSDACPTFDAVFDDLIEMEEDLHQHIHLENNILFPRAIELENKTA